jgi:hypothetical protein
VQNKPNSSVSSLVSNFLPEQISKEFTEFDNRTQETGVPATDTFKRFSLPGNISFVIQLHIYMAGTP